jgi:hypothetical protein
MTLVGIIWAGLAPLLMVPVVALLVVMLRLTGWSKFTRIAVATICVVVPVGTVWWLDYREFEGVCKRVGKPQIFTRAVAEGIFLDSSTANSFGMRYLDPGSFHWMEMRSIYDPEKIEHVTRLPDGRTRSEPVDTITARYEVRETAELPFHHTTVMMRRIIDRETGQVMAQAGSAHFDGGRTMWLLGVYGSRHYPDINHGDDFRTYYDLAKRTLR